MKRRWKALKFDATVFGIFGVLIAVNRTCLHFGKKWTARAAVPLAP